MMPTAVLAFQVHQPYRLRRYSVFDRSPQYFDQDVNHQIIARVAERSYLPALATLAAAAERLDDELRFGIIASGTALEQLAIASPATIEAMQRLCDAGVVEMLATPFHHALPGRHPTDELADQIELHAQLLRTTFGQTPAVLANTALSYDDELARIASTLNFRGILADLGESGGPLGPNAVYAADTPHRLAVLPRHVSLSDDLAWRMGDPQWPNYPLSPERFASWVAGCVGQVTLLSLDLATFGEHHDAASGSLDFLSRLPLALREAGVPLSAPAEAVALPARTPLHSPVTPVVQNPMQQHAAQELWNMEEAVKTSGDEQLLAIWRRLTASDHINYLATRLNTDATVFRPFSPYDSPYDGYINLMNVLDHLKTRLPSNEAPAPAPAEQVVFRQAPKTIIPARNNTTARRVAPAAALSPLQQVMAAVRRRPARVG